MVSDFGFGVAEAVDSGVGESVGATGVPVKSCVGKSVGVIESVGVASGAFDVTWTLQAANQNNTNAQPNCR